MTAAPSDKPARGYPGDPGEWKGMPVERRLQANFDDNASLTNYTSQNPVIRILLGNFMRHIGQLLDAIDAVSLCGLDAGCGEGHLLDYLFRWRHVRDMIGIDLDAANLRYATRHYPHCDYMRGSISDLPFADNSFDYILSTEVFEHLPTPARALEEIRRVARPGAHLIVSVPFEPFFHWGNLVRGLYWDRGGRTPDHVSFWHRHEFCCFLSTQVTIARVYSVATFPWILVAGRFD